MLERRNIPPPRFPQPFQAHQHDGNEPSHFHGDLDVRVLIFDKQLELGRMGHQFRSFDSAQALIRHAGSTKLVWGHALGERTRTAAYAPEPKDRRMAGSKRLLDRLVEKRNAADRHMGRQEPPGAQPTRYQRPRCTSCHAQPKTCQMMPTADGEPLGDRSPGHRLAASVRPVAMAFRADPETRKVEIIMCTGTPEVTLREVADYHGFLTKPVALTDLMRSLDLAFKTH